MHFISPPFFFRGSCVKYIDPRDIPKAATDPLPALPRGLRELKPVSDQLFRAYRSMYSYDRTPFNAPIQRLDSTNEDWTTEKVSYTAPMGMSRQAPIYFFPKKNSSDLCRACCIPGRWRAFPSLVTAVSYCFPGCHSAQRTSSAVSGVQGHLWTSWRHQKVSAVSDQQLSRPRNHVGQGCFARHRLCGNPDLDHEKLAYYGFLGRRAGRNHSSHRSAHSSLRLRAGRTTLSTHIFRGRQH